jgi:hypothetical protein
MAGSRPVVEVRGGRELRRTLKAAGDDLSDLKDANQRVGNVVVARATSLAPRRSGALAGAMRATRAATSVTVKAGGARVPYAGPIHWGWPARGITAQPFLSDAATGTESTWVPIYESELDRIIERVKGDQ